MLSPITSSYLGDGLLFSFLILYFDGFTCYNYLSVHSMLLIVFLEV